MDTELTKLRADIDDIDERLISLLAERSKAVQALWAWKTRRGVARFDAEREEAVRTRALKRADALGLDATAVGEVLRAIIGRTLLR